MWSGYHNTLLPIDTLVALSHSQRVCDLGIVIQDSADLLVALSGSQEVCDLAISIQGSLLIPLWPCHMLS